MSGPGSHRSRAAPIEVRKAERELFFWTIERALKVISLAALTVYAVVSLAEGRLPGAEILHHIF